MSTISDYTFDDSGNPLHCQYCDSIGRWRGGIGGPYQWVVCDFHYNDFDQQYMNGKRPGQWILHDAPSEAKMKALRDFKDAQSKASVGSQSR